MQARDSYYKCLLDLGIDIKSSGPVPPQCKALRNTFEKSCLSSWVRNHNICPIIAHIFSIETKIAWRMAPAGGTL